MRRAGGLAAVEERACPRRRRLRFIQSISSGTDWYDREVLRAHGIRLASAAGVNAEAVAQHAMALMLALRRRLPEARDNQRARHWRGMISEIAAREDQLTGKTLLVVGLGRIGTRLAHLAKAFGMRVIATRRNPAGGAAGVDAVAGNDGLHELLGQADIVAITCPLTPETENLVDAAALAAMRPTAHLINVARGRIVDEPALIRALQEGRIAAAALDVTVEEPLPQTSPLWSLPNVLITPHVAGETQSTRTGSSTSSWRTWTACGAARLSSTRSSDAPAGWSAVGPPSRRSSAAAGLQRQTSLRWLLDCESRVEGLEGPGMAANPGGHPGEFTRGGEATQHPSGPAGRAMVGVAARTRAVGAANGGCRGRDLRLHRS